ncbi:MAG TPA: M20/M25/M40 family metallo-hydrolase [Thermosynechococcaceae cyanobacterium]
MTDLKGRLRSHLAEIVRERDAYLATAGHFFVRQYIRSQLTQWGTIEVHEFTEQGIVFENLILNLPGTSPHKQPIIIGAHYDTVPGSPGADDNGTGVAVLLELARSLTEDPAKHPVRLIAFDLEETSYDKAGSTHYVRSLQQQPIRLMLSLEMLGYCDRAPNSQRYPIDLLRRFYPDRGDFIGLIGNPQSIPDLIHLSHHITKAGVACRWLPVPNQGRILPDTRRSDHAPFWDRGDRALMVTDTAHLRNPNYHKSSDRLETLDLDFLTGICRGLISGIRYL